MKKVIQYARFCCLRYRRYSAWLLKSLAFSPRIPLAWSAVYRLELGLRPSEKIAQSSINNAYSKLQTFFINLPQLKLGVSI